MAEKSFRPCLTHADECHHAVAQQYRRILSYFKPKFMLGLTATPERMDGKNIYELCDYNVPYEINLQEAINKGMLVPFHYYGIWDATIDYSNIHRIQGKYVEKELEDCILKAKNRLELIYRHYMKYRSKRALGFCCSKQHAEEMAKQFCKRNIAAVAVYSNATGEFSEARDEAIRKLRDREIKVIFSVDMFNEGLDICEIDMVMFLRPTESPTVFLQQLGRGLRISTGKNYLNVLDFVGNYEKAGMAPFLLSGERYSTEKARTMQQQDFEFPQDCIVDFDLQLIDLFQEMAKKRTKKEERIKEEYFRIKELLGKVPTRMDLFTYMEDEVYQLCSSYKSNPFRNYLRYLNSLGELNKQQSYIYNSIGNEFLNVLETTQMTKSYKMPVLLAFYNNGMIKTAIDEEDIYRSYMHFYHTANNWKDLNKDRQTSDFETWDKKRCVSEAMKNPVKFLLQSGKEFFIKEEGKVLALHPSLKQVVTMDGFAEQMKDVIDWRTIDYYQRRYRKE